MKNDTMLTLTSLLAIVLMSLHLSDDVTRGFDPGGLNNLIGIAILLVWLVGATLLVGRRTGYLILILGSLFAALVPALHFSGKGVGGALAASDGGQFFIWTLLALGVSGAFALILTLRGMWDLRRQKPAASRSAEMLARPST
jgi:hypothetical protein